VGYVDQLVGDKSAGEAPGGVEFEFSDNLRSTADVDVVHLTALSAVLGDRRVPQSERVRRARRFVKTLGRRRIALVRTVFGNGGGSTRAVSRAEAILDRSTSSYIVLDATAATPHDRPVTVIRHSHLRDRFLGYPRARTVPGRLVLASTGTFHPAYEAPLKVFAVANLADYTLRLVGKVPSALTDSFARTVSRYPATISLREDPLSDAGRVEEITQAELVIVASPDSYEAHSLIILALSLDRPVLVEDTASTRRLADEVGHDWVRLHEGRLTAATLETAVEDLRAHPPTGRPDLAAREPNVIAAQYAAVFRGAAAR
jgi:hypothetical protein